MSKLKDFNGDNFWQFTENDIVCPYCGEYHDANGEYDEDDCEMECDECHRMFVVSSEVSIEYTTQKDCKLNDEPHAFKDIGLDHHDVCQKCGKWADNQ